MCLFFIGRCEHSLGNMRFTSLHHHHHGCFRLIVVAEKQVVYDKFPIPLINRLEKHFLTLNNIMTTTQLHMAARLEAWAKDFTATLPGGTALLHLPR
jgi:hypothetical protein